MQKFDILNIILVLFYSIGRNVAGLSNTVRLILFILIEKNCLLVAHCSFWDTQEKNHFQPKDVSQLGYIVGFFQVL